MKNWDFVLKSQFSCLYSHFPVSRVGSLIRTSKEPFKKICKLMRCAFGQEFFGDLVEYTTVTMDEVERVLELDSPSLIE